MNIREWTLPVYTILTQLSVGALFVIWVIRTLSSAKLGAVKVDQDIKIPVLILLTTAIAAIIFAHFHLSRPYLSFLALRNLRSSWLSRELFTNLIYIICVGILLISLRLVNNRYKVNTALGWVAIMFGFATDYCMSRVYILPSQPAWNSLLTPTSFLVTTFLLGVMTVPVLLTMDLIFKKSQGQAGQVVHAQLIEASLGRLAFMAITMGILMAIINFFQSASLFSGNAAAQTSLNLLLNIYQPLLIVRLVLLFIGVGWLGVIAVQLHQKKLAAESLLLQVFIACLLVMVAEILGRFLFYAIHVRIGI